MQGAFAAHEETVPVCNLVGDGEAEPGAVGIGSRGAAMETLEDMRQLIGSDAAAMMRNADKTVFSPPSLSETKPPQTLRMDAERE